MKHEFGTMRSFHTQHTVIHYY